VILVGLGSPFGDDRVGWVVARAVEDGVLGGADAHQVQVICLGHPGPALLDAIAGQDEAILVDAVVTAGPPPGTVHRLTGKDLMAAPEPASSHGLGLGHALQLGRALAILPPRLSVYLVSIDPDQTRHPDADLTPPVAAAVLPLAREILRAMRTRQ
jgi:hydrogenase maturation protease